MHTVTEMVLFNQRLFKSIADKFMTRLFETNHITTKRMIHGSNDSINVFITLMYYSTNDFSMFLFVYVAVNFDRKSKWNRYYLDVAT